MKNQRLTKMRRLAYGETNPALQARYALEYAAELEKGVIHKDITGVDGQEFESALRMAQVLASSAQAGVESLMAAKQSLDRGHAEVFQQNIELASTDINNASRLAGSLEESLDEISNALSDQMMSEDDDEADKAARAKMRKGRSRGRLNKASSTSPISQKLLDIEDRQKKLSDELAALYQNNADSLSDTVAQAFEAAGLPMMQAGDKVFSIIAALNKEREMGRTGGKGYSVKAQSGGRLNKTR